MAILARAHRTIADLNDPIQQGSAPEHPGEGTLWLDTSGVPNVFRRWTAGEWVECNPDVESALETAKGNLLTDIKSMYATLEDLGQVSQTVSTSVTQTAQDIEWAVTRSRNYAVELTDTMRANLDTVMSYMRFSEAGLDLGVLDSPFAARLGNTRLSFLQNGGEVAYISNNKLCITRAEISGTLSVGDPLGGYLDMVSTPSGVGFVWREA